MRIALIGSNGQLGSDLLPRLQTAGHDVVPLRHADIEITDKDNVAAVLEPLRPDLVLNTAAYNLVDKAEDEPDVAMLVNAAGPQNLARLCAVNGWRLMQISTDYVFDGATDPTSARRGSPDPAAEPTAGLPKPPSATIGRPTVETAAGSGAPRRAPLLRPWTELDLVIPNGRYALTKWTGEQLVLAGCSRSFVVRTCGLYGLAALHGAGKGNFVETMLRLGRERKQLRVVDDQTCTPTSSADLADALVKLIATDAFGLYHATNSGSMTWCEFAREIFRLAKLDVEVIPITTAEFGAKAMRPAYSVLD